jgi:hypothetical protein
MARNICDGNVMVSSIRKLSSDNMVYNFEVADNHNYFVGKSGILVHNKNIFFLKQIESIKDK